jgi:hypothetical protein
MDVKQHPVAIFRWNLVGVTMKTFTPSMVDGSIFTCSRSVMAGIVGKISAFLFSAALRHSSPVFQRSCHAGLSGAAISFCMPGLTSAGTGIDFAGTSRGACVTSSALTPTGPVAVKPTISATNSMVNLFGFIAFSLPAY